MTIIDGDDVDIIPAKFVWQIRDAMKRLNKLELNVLESSTPSPLQTPKRPRKESSQDTYSLVASSNSNFQRPKARQVAFPSAASSATYSTPKNSTTALSSGKAQLAHLVTTLLESYIQKERDELEKLKENLQSSIIKENELETKLCSNKKH